MSKTKYKTYKNGDGVKEYDHIDEWKELFQQKKNKKPDYLTIGDMPEWYELLKKYLK